jgi:hypothetical protein
VPRSGGGEKERNAHGVTSQLGVIHAIKIMRAEKGIQIFEQKMGCHDK